MKKSNLTRSLMAACSIVALSAVMYGCSSSGKNSANMRAADAESALAALQEAYGEEAITADGINQLQSEVTRLTGELSTATGSASELQTQLNTANGEVTRLTGELNTANGEVTRLTGELSTSTGSASELQTQLNTANGEVTRLTGELNTANGEVTRLTGELNTANGEVTRLTGELNTANGRVASANSMVRAFMTAQDAADDATGAVTAATAAVTAATEASMAITARAAGVAGDSETVRENAQSVLDARDKANAAVKTAQGSLRAAEAALANVDDSTPAGDALKRALAAAVKTATEQLAMATEQAEGDDLKAAVAAVENPEGADTEAMDYMAMTPADHATAAAMEIGMALMPTSTTDGALMHGEHGNAAPAVTFADAVSMNDHQGKTWEEIVGSANVEERRLGTDGGGTTAVRAMSISGMTLVSTQDVTEEDADPVADGTQVAGEYKGIVGTVFCQGSDCRVEAVPDVGTSGESGFVDNSGNKKLVGAWFFTPTSTTDWHLGTTTDGVTTYAVENTYATFGHWLDVDGTDTQVNTFALTTANTGGLNVTTVDETEGATTLTESSATYSGDAAGMSVHKTYKTDGTINTIDSGAFTADVDLKATFGASPTLGGTVDNFQGAAVDSRWEVELQVTAFTGAALTDGRTVATGRDGEWVATGYGVSGERPMGIFGGFNAHFTDGHAAGAYATRRD